MLKRVIEVSHAGTRLSVRLGQLVVARDGAELGRIPCEDVGVLLVDHAGVVYTHTVFTELLQHARRWSWQWESSPGGDASAYREQRGSDGAVPQADCGQRAIEKQLWKQVVQAKIRHQAHLVPRRGHTGGSGVLRDGSAAEIQRTSRRRQASDSGRHICLRRHFAAAGPCQTTCSTMDTWFCGQRLRGRCAVRGSCRR